MAMLTICRIFGAKPLLKKNKHQKHQKQPHYG